MLNRSIEYILKTALKISPIVLLKGARQVGKSTLAMSLSKNYIVLDDVSTRISAKDDPNRFIENLEKPICIDEIQKAPELLESLKLYIDKNRNNGDFLITGSANILDMKAAKDTLAGRIIEVDLYPLSLKEKTDRADENIIDAIFDKKFDISIKYKNRLIKDIINGGYPEVLNFETALEKKLWFASYISTYIERDARDLGEFRDIDSFFRFVNVIAPRSTTLLNKSEIAKAIGIRTETVENYLSILKQTFQIKLLPPYFENIGKQFIKSSKIYLNDTGVMSYFLKINSTKNFEQSEYKGALVETFVLNELIKHLSFCTEETQIFHYRTNNKKEIDFILKRDDKIIAIEIKSSSKVSKSDFKHIIDFQKHSKKDIFGIVFYMGENLLYFEKNCVALPILYFY
jgi:predicted AAA+ superfamily ATPase